MSLARDLLETQNRLVELETQELALPRVIEAAFVNTGIADNTATDLFNISTTNESGSTDGGGYAVYIHALVGRFESTVTNAAAKSLTAHYVRVLGASGATGVNSAVSEIDETASAAVNAASRDVGTVTITVVENTEFSCDIQITVDMTGTAAPHTVDVVCFVRVLWYGFLTAPVLSQL